MSDVSRCSNCDEPIKDGMFSSNLALDEADVRLINAGLGLDLRMACGKCGPGLKDKAAPKVGRMRLELRSELAQLLHTIPLASIHSPQGWTYDVLELVTAQSVTGTGVFSEVTSAFTDLFGAQSGTYNKKIRAGEEICRSALRAQALHLGGDAIVGVDVDYAEVGGQRAMLMVCMTGTAVRLTGGNLRTPEFAASIKTMREKKARLAELDLLPAD